MSAKMENLSTIKANLSSILLSTLDEHVFMAHLVEHFSGIIKSESIVAYRILEDSSAELVNQNGQVVNQGQILAKGKGAVGHVVRTKRPYFSNSVQRDPIFATESDKTIKTEMIIPVMVDGFILGTIHFQSRNEELTFKREDITSALEILNEVKLPLSNMKLFVEAKYMNSSLQRKIEEKEKEINGAKLNISVSDNFKIEDKAIIGRSEGMQKLLGLVDKIAPTDIPALILGEAGTGKEMIARKIHCKSLRNLHAFIAIDCTTLNESELESEIFGEEVMDFTLNRHKVGLLESAHGGTLYLNNIDALSLPLQSKILNVVNEKVAMRKGGKSTYRADIRFIASSCKDLQNEIEAGRMREDLYYAINTVLLKAPSLKERRDDIEVLAHHFLNAGKNSAQHKSLSPCVINALLEHSWPGNVRELQNVMERAYILADGMIVEKDHLADSISRSAKVEEKVEVANVSFKEMTLEELEKNHICNTLEHLAGNKTKTAKMLGITVKTLYNKLHSYGMIDAKEA